MSERNAQAASTASTKRSAASRKSARELEAAGRIADLEKRLNEIQRNIQLTAASISDKEEDLNDLKASPDTTPAAIRLSERELTQLRRTLRDLKVDDTFASIDLEREKRLLEKRVELDVAIIADAENNSQEVSEEEVSNSGTQYEQARSRKSDDSDDSEVLRDLNRRLQDLRGFKIDNNTPSSPPTAARDEVTPPESNSQTGELMKSLAQATLALTLVATKPDNKSTDKFLARQSHAKELPYFSGRAEEWPAFKTMYDRSTEICGFSDSENMCRLHKSLKGEALEFVRCLLVSPDNVKNVMDTLEMRFGRPEHIIKSLFDQIKDAARVREDRLPTLIQFGTTVNNLVSTVKALKKPGYASNPLIVEELESKLPTNYVMEWVTWVRSCPTRERDLDYFAQWIMGKIQVACEICPPVMTSATKKEDRDERKKRTPHHNSFFSKGEETKSTSPPQKTSSGCRWCRSSGHILDVCRKFANESTEKKWDFVKKSKLCFVCLEPGHSKFQCQKDKHCGKGECRGLHHAHLHGDLQPTGAEPSSTVTQPEVSGNVNNTNGSLLRVLPVTLRGPKGTVQTYALLDEGSTLTMISADLSERLGLVGREAPLKIQWIDKKTKTEQGSRKVSLHVKGKGSQDKEFLLRNVRTVETLRMPEYSLDLESLKKRWSHLRPLQMESISNATPTILIGVDNAKLTAHRGILEGPPHAPIATKSRFGWAVAGPQGGNSNGVFSCFHVCEKTESDKQLHEMVKQHFLTESYGVRLDAGKPKSRGDKRALEILEATTQRLDGGRWQAGLLWRKEDCVLPESKKNALHRLKCQERRMDRDQKFAEQYCSKIQEYVDKGYVTKLDKTAADETSSRTWYLPHFGVYNPNKPGKIRLVFDAAAKSNGMSLNDALLTGPDLLNTLQSVLLRFRQKKIAFTGDITDMFHRVFVKPEDRNSQRFLWRGLDRDRDPDVYVMNVMTFGATSSPSTSLYIKERNAEEFRAKYPEAVEENNRNFYMDDFLGNADNEQEAIRLIREVIEINAAGGMTVCKVMCNSPIVMTAIPPELRCVGKKVLTGKEEHPVERVLGLHWDHETDEFVFRLNFAKVAQDIVDGTKTPTKREIARLVMSVFDPMGFISPFKMRGLALLQSAWKNELDWDDQVPMTLLTKWRSWLEQLPLLKEVRVRRCYSLLMSTSEETQLHTFVDASEEAYTAVSYLRIKKGDQVDVTIVASKVRVAPTKKVTIPRMELMAAQMGALLSKSIRDELTLPVHKNIMWSDSMTVLCWIRSEDGRFNQFVSNRVGEIHEKTEVGEWRWVPTALNVADDATRTDTPLELHSGCRWITGPEFLKEDELEWPQEKTQPDPVNPDDLELTESALVVTEEESVREQVPKIDKFSSMIRLLRSTAAVEACARVWKTYKRRAEKQVCVYNVTVDDMRRAETRLWRQAQLESFAEELKLLQLGRPVDKRSRLAKLSVYLDTEGVMRLRGRIGRSDDVLQETKQPVVLDSKNPFTRLLLDHHHRQGAHQGQERVVNELRAKYWILDIRSAVRSTWSRCGECRIRRAIPTQPEIGDLPAARLKTGGPPFAATGVDYFGPMEVTIGRRREKRWGVLFTCMVTRAIHLEVSPSLDTDNMLMALMRFVNRRGRPTEIHSDNGTNFRGADTELKACLASFDQEKLRSVMTNRGIKWHFIPPAAPHFGGAWERLVGLTKKTLGRILKEQAPREYTLLTFMTEVENIVNSRPLTHVSLDPDDPESLTPNHFLRMSSFGGPSLPVEADDDDLFLRKQWRRAQRMADIFWQRWVTEYLPSLVKKEKWTTPSPAVQVGDVVIMVNDQLPRNNWLKGIVEATFPGKDGVTRVVEVRTILGTYRRPVTKICPLNIRSVGTVNLHGGRNVAGGDEDKPPTTTEESRSLPQSREKSEGGVADKGEEGLSAVRRREARKATPRVAVE